MKNRKRKIQGIALLLIVLLGVCAVYTFSKYVVFAKPIETIEVTFDKRTLDIAVPILYINKALPTKIDFEDELRFTRINDTALVLNGLSAQNISRFQIYFEVPGKAFKLKSLTISNSDTSQSVSLDGLRAEESISVHDDGSFDVHKINSYIEIPFLIVNQIPYLKILMFLLVLMALIFWALLKTKILDYLAEANKKDFLFIIFLLSIYSLPPLYNVALIMALLFYIKDFNLRLFKSNPLNIIFILFFLIYLINVIFLRDGEIREFSTIERLMPLAFIPILLSSVNLKNALYYLSLSALAICTTLFAFALIDFGILERYEVFSFEEFAKHFHPIYLSYLVFVAICYFQQFYPHRSKYIYQLILFLFLIFLASKLVLAITVPLYFLFYIDTRRKFLYLTAFVLAIIASIVFFKPLNQRFAEIMNFDDLSIVQESKIEDNNDKRINGLSLRLILWGETMETMDGWQEYVFGNGVTKSKTKDLQVRLQNLGLTSHTSFNPHNQFVDTFWKTGLVGCYILILIFIMAFSISIKSKDRMLFIVTLFIFISMLTESVFGRVVGVYFVPTVLLILTNRNFQMLTHVKVVELNADRKIQ